MEEQWPLTAFSGVKGFSRTPKSHVPGSGSPPAGLSAQVDRNVPGLWQVQVRPVLAQTWVSRKAQMESEEGEGLSSICS